MRMVVVRKQLAAETFEAALDNCQPRTHRELAVQTARVGWHANAILMLKAKAVNGNLGNRPRLAVQNNHTADNANQERTELADWVNFPYFQVQMFDAVPRSQPGVALQVHQL